MNLNAASLPPLISNVNIEPPPLGNIFCIGHFADGYLAMGGLPFLREDALINTLQPSLHYPCVCLVLGIEFQLLEEARMRL